MKTALRDLMLIDETIPGLGQHNINEITEGGSVIARGEGRIRLSSAGVELKTEISSDLSSTWVATLKVALSNGLLEAS